MKAQRKLSFERYLQCTEVSYQEIIKFENFLFITAQETECSTHYLIGYKNSYNNEMEYYELDVKDFCDLLVMYLGGTKELLLMNKLFEELMALTNQSYIVESRKGDDVNG
jgi:hypothetical protein